MNTTIGIIGAMDIEIEALVDALEDKEITELYGYKFYSGHMADKNIVILKCGVGKVNAARGTQLMIDRFAPDAILNTGIAGAIDPDLNIGDTVVATALVQHDFDVTAFGYAPGCICDRNNMDKPTAFAADPELVSELTIAAESVMDGAVREGIIATGDRFVSSEELKRKIYEIFHAAATEMEGAAIAQTAAYAGVPFAVLRVMSDTADGKAPESYEQFELKAAGQSAEVTKAFIKNYSR